MRLLQYEKLQKVVSVISGLSIKLLSASTAFCDKPDSVLGRAFMALPFYLFYWSIDSEDCPEVNFDKLASGDFAISKMF